MTCWNGYAVERSLRQVSYVIVLVLKAITSKFLLITNVISTTNYAQKRKKYYSKRLIEKTLWKQKPPY